MSQQREALNAKANTGKFPGPCAEKPAEPNSAKTAKRWEGFCAWCSQRNGFVATHEIANIFMISLAQMGKITRNGTLKQTFHSKVFFGKGKGNQKPKKNHRKES